MGPFDIPANSAILNASPGGDSTLEYRESCHIWLAIFRGKGQVLLGDEIHWMWKLVILLKFQVKRYINSGLIKEIISGLFA